MRVAVIIPCYRVRSSIVSVIDSIGAPVENIYVVDDCCPENTGEHVVSHCNDTRVKVLTHNVNQGVGGAVMTGYRAAMDDGMDIMVKVDGDGQMDADRIPELIRPIQNLDADYVKGNRFFSLHMLQSMPFLRIMGNAILSFVTKLSSGYWKIFDPTNGFTALSSVAAERLSFEKLSKRYFFETDMLIQLGEVRAVVQDIPMEAIYGEENSGLKIRKILFEFLFSHMRAITRRIFYTYFIRDFSLGSLNLIAGLALGTFGAIFGGFAWAESIRTDVTASAGTVMIAVLPIILSVQFLLAFLAQDINNEPSQPLVRNKFNKY